MAHSIGLDPDDICIPDQIGIGNNRSVYKPDIGQFGLDLSGPGIMAAKHNDSVATHIWECNIV